MKNTLWTPGSPKTLVVLSRPPNHESPSLTHSVAPNPKPATASPATSPFLSGNHLTPTAIGTTYARPIPAPPMIPIQTNCAAKLVPRNPPRIYPSPSTIPPMTAIGRGPKRSCRRPPTTVKMAKTARPAEKTPIAWRALKP